MAQEGWKLEQEEAPCTPTASSPKLCANNCGLFGSVATMNLCSSCYKTLKIMKANSPARTTPHPIDPESAKNEEISAVPLPSASSTSASSSSAAVAAAMENLPSASMETSYISLCKEPQRAQPLRCFLCQKKVGLRGFKCRCGDVFCALHRYSEKHACSFDYKAAGRASIAKANPVVKADKLHRI